MKICRKYKLTCGNGLGKCDEYSPHIDASHLLESGHGAFRIFHANAPDFINFLNASGEIVKIMTLGDAFHQDQIRILETMYEESTRGMLCQEWRQGEFGYGEEVRILVLVSNLFHHHFQIHRNNFR